MDSWLTLDDPFELLAKAIGPPWEPGTLESARLEPVAWHRLEGDDAWEHQCAWCARGRGGSVCVHRLRLRGDAAEINESLSRLVDEELAGADAAEAASNIGGRHSRRDLWRRPGFEAAAALLERAVALAARHEAAALQRPPLLLDAAAPEAWLNVHTRAAGGWNALHTHAGSAYSATFFADDGGCCAPSAHRLEGRLALLTAAPTDLPPRHGVHVRPDDSSGAACCGDAPPDPLRYMLLAPQPGTCVVFPSFVPHFVTPCRAREHGGAEDAETDAACARRRVSVACNFVAE